jgi:hypothetical protein
MLLNRTAEPLGQHFGLALANSGKQDAKAARLEFGHKVHLADDPTQRGGESRWQELALRVPVGEVAVLAMDNA